MRKTEVFFEVIPLLSYYAVPSCTRQCMGVASFHSFHKRKPRDISISFYVVDAQNYS